MTLRFTIHSETVVNPRTGTTYDTFYAVDAATGHRIAGTDGATEDDARWMCRHWNTGAREAVPEPVTSGSIRYTVPQTWPVKASEA